MVIVSCRRLCTQIPEEWSALQEAGEDAESALLPLVRDIAVYCLEHSAEAEACDTLMEVERVGMLKELVTEDIHERVCLYLTRWALRDSLLIGRSESCGFVVQQSLSMNLRTAIPYTIHTVL